MNQSKKLELSKETLRCLDDQDLTDVAGGNRGYSHNCFSGNCPSVQGACVSVQCQSIGICDSVLCGF
jgi:natural product precursor